MLKGKEVVKILNQIFPLILCMCVKPKRAGVCDLMNNCSSSLKAIPGEPQVIIVKSFLAPLWINTCGLVTTPQNNSCYQDQQIFNKHSLTFASLNGTLHPTVSLKLP